MPAAPRLPDYSCAIITGVDDRLLLQLRPAHARHAPGLLTCFGGRREGHEGPRECLLRELTEELGWAPPVSEPVCDLERGDLLIARFFRCPMAAGTPLVTEPGHLALWAAWRTLPGLPVSAWHRLVLEAVADGRTSVALPER
jgi:8-oxo-dGTP pyrophosphatase MutT (NUDIX family)